MTGTTISADVRDGICDGPKAAPRSPGYATLCRDFDGDCFAIENKLKCWLYDPEQGVCPFLTGEYSDG